jgi:hypothetical protein
MEEEGSRDCYEPGDEVDQAMERLAKAIGEHRRGRRHLGLIAEVIAELFCRIDVYRSMAASRERRARRQRRPQ